MHWFGTEGDYKVLVMDRLGKSLEQLFTQCGRKFSLKTTLMLADQMLARLEYVHRKQFIHRDIKPDNFLVGQGPFENVVFLIDFGLAKRYIDPTNQEHIPFREDKQLTGTARYASLNAHIGIEQSRRDDLEALGYLWLYFLRGKLPWQGLAGSNGAEKYDKIRDMKQNLSIRELCKDVPREFYQYFKRVKQMKFDETPNYAGLRRLLSSLMQKEGMSMDYKFDWKESPDKRYHRAPHAAPSSTAAASAKDGEDATQVVELIR